MRLIFLYGLPGVGKLTVARELGDLTGYKVFHNHLTVDLVASVFDFGSEPFVELREMFWLAVFAQSVKANLPGLIFTFAAERTVRQRFLTDALEIIESGGGEVLFVELTCEVEELERRIAHPGRQSFGKLSSVTQFHKLKDAGAFAGPVITDTRLVVDTTELPAFDAASLIAKELNLNQSD